MYPRFVSIFASNVASAHLQEVALAALIRATTSQISAPRDPLKAPSDLFFDLLFSSCCVNQFVLFTLDNRFPTKNTSSSLTSPALYVVLLFKGS
ncbi:hypothetical protein BT63DRAFT_199988 [Microthyrium microscopicum]|uniref:Uncharacterized protein n=1 Tax=Microthyrium microscopicum TaxID=703497 RepID=A0A6A6UIM4_9PEZI|nr:hypothetical protein BT63DRAFT_199988 [Microthyrium microscopicum]